MEHTKKQNQKTAIIIAAVLAACLIIVPLVMIFAARSTSPINFLMNKDLSKYVDFDIPENIEYSDVEADIKGSILSVKNPKSGHITADAVGEVIFGDAVMECTGEVHIR